MLTFVLLFQPWLSASGPYGDVHTDAFGRINGSVPALRIFGEPVVSISDLWGMVIGATAAATLIGAHLHRIFGVGRSLAIAAGMANVVFVPLTLLYLNGKAPELEDMTKKDNDELKETLGNILNSVFGGGKESAADTAQGVATATLTNQSLVCGVVVAVTAAIAVSMRIRIRSARSEAEPQCEVSDGPAAGVPLQAHDGDDVVERKLEHQLHHEYELLVRPEADDLGQVEDYGIGKQRLLPRTERPHRNDSQTRPTRRERHPRPRPANPASDKPQSARWLAASRSGRLATVSHASPTPLFRHQPRNGEPLV
ncbi:hypothetical protein ACFXNW_10485 [Nocardia sp. NPDC059180]|uniref:hypothetical protein n=1 Tax=Nocardia sp. NPDC059180 TaxID=3346761 RepID=UPI0036B2CB27